MSLQLGRFLSLARRLSAVVRFCSTANSMNILLTGFQPTGVPHLGNYLGVIRPLCRIHSSLDISSMLIMIADLHALTSTQEIDLSHSILELSAALIACFELQDGEKSRKVEPLIFQQSAIRGHTELAWILASCCSLPVSDKLWENINFAVVTD
ncbi:hypothetical protein FGIG_05053 [Fasciola gigantica]|uniref:Tryptophanyl-tRNA synthetase n=1 Tax=Fasciola gigantica TaxID=46835 RepID=A0A504YK03_FASGI|nr:hypothetical protein FGIG_05053 [Fasciola gigantica]